jgi:hypothetical protein
MKNWVIGAILVLLVATAYYYFKIYQPDGPHGPTTKTLAVEEPVKKQTRVPETSSPEPVAEPEPQPETGVEEEKIPLPTLVESDPVVLESLGGLLGQSAVAGLIVNDNVISRFVATIDMLGGRKVPAIVQAIEGPEGKLLVTLNANPETVISNEAGDLIPQFFIDPANFSRYTPYVEMLEAADTVQLTENYRFFYPLLQEAYRQMGYADGDFNTRLVATIDDLLATPETMEPVALMKPEAYFLYSDPDLESRSAGQKILLRMGTENAARVKSKLAEIRAAL